MPQSIAPKTAEPTTPAMQPPLVAPPLPVPDGFKPRRLGGGFIEVNGPFYTRVVEQRLQMGFRVEPRHANPMNICHGGMMASFCDMLLPISAHYLSKEVSGRFLPTINLQIDFLAGAPMGAWVQGEAEVLRVTRSMVFMQGLVSADGVRVARVSGIFKMGPVFGNEVMPSA